MDEKIDTNIMAATNPQSKRRSNNTQKDGGVPIEVKNNWLKQCFTTVLVRGKIVNISCAVVRQSLGKQFNINVPSLDPTLANALPYLLVYHINHWPGWQRSLEYFRGSLTFNDFYESFFNFLKEKLLKAINKDYNEITSVNNMIDKGTEYDVASVEAPFIITVTGKPALLNTIVFTDTVGGDVTLKTHLPMRWLESDIRSISIKQILSWPHVGVRVFSPILSFSRRNIHEFRRCISLGHHNPLPSSARDFIEKIEIINVRRKRDRYSVDYIEELVSNFMNALGYMKSIPVVNDVVYLYKEILKEFLSDIEELNIVGCGRATLASNTSALFNIGKCAYFRNKKLQKNRGKPSLPSDAVVVCYNEIIIPKMEVSVMEIADPYHLSLYLGRVRKFNKSKEPLILPQIMFNCTFCNLSFPSVPIVVKHFAEHHKLEPPMKCVVCKSSFSALELTKNRWWHECRGAKK